MELIPLKSRKVWLLSGWQVIVRVMVVGTDARRIEKTPAVDAIVTIVEAGHPVNEQQSILFN